MDTSDALKVLVIGENDRLHHSLGEYGYDVFFMPKIGANVENSIAQYRPDVILISIDPASPDESLALGQILHQMGTKPFIYLNSHPDDATLYRAQQTHPHGYHVMPMDPVNLHTSIECAIYCFAKGRTENTLIHQLRTEYEHLKKRAFNIKENSSTVKVCDCYQFKIQNYTLHYKNSEIKMTKKERALITLMIAQIGSIVDFDQIIRYVWGSNYQTHHDVRTLIWRFNRKLPIPLIQNAMGIGYYIEH